MYQFMRSMWPYTQTPIHTPIHPNSQDVRACITQTPRHVPMPLSIKVRFQSPSQTQTPTIHAVIHQYIRPMWHTPKHQPIRTFIHSFIHPNTRHVIMHHTCGHEPIHAPDHQVIHPYTQSASHVSMHQSIHAVNVIIHPSSEGYPVCVCERVSVVMEMVTYI